MDEKAAYTVYMKKGREELLFIYGLLKIQKILFKSNCLIFNSWYFKFIFPYLFFPQKESA